MALEIFCDGSCLDNQNPENRRAGLGYVVVEDGERVHEESEYVGDGEDVSNNVAEYEAVLAALEWRKFNRPGEDVRVYTDSTLIVNQVSGEWSCNENHLFTRAVRARGMLGEDDSLTEVRGSNHIARAHDLAKSGASQEDPPKKTTGTKTKNRSGRTTITEIEVEPLDEAPRAVEQPHPGIVPPEIPDELKRHRQWINWKPVKDGDRETKVPINPSNVREAAKSDDKGTWTDFKSAVGSVTHNIPGIGFVLTTGDPYVAIDIDDCRDPETLEIEDWAEEIAKSLNSYTQVSVSNTGLHVFVKAADGVPDSWKNKKEQERELEIYEWGRFITMTGHRPDWAPREIVEQPHFDVWCRQIERTYYD